MFTVWFASLGGVAVTGRKKELSIAIIIVMIIVVLMISIVIIIVVIMIMITIFNVIVSVAKRCGAKTQKQCQTKNWKRYVTLGGTT